MESHGEFHDKRSRSRPAIIRRSCDPCRSRKIACHRGQPCANCTSSGVQCTYSAVAHDSPRKQRINLSAHYEKKIEDIARDVETMRALLEQHHTSSSTEGVLFETRPRPDLIKPASAREKRASTPDCGQAQWDHPGHIVDFVKAVANNSDENHNTPEADEVLSSLKNLVQALEDPTPKQRTCPPVIDSASPPLEAILAVLRWSKGQISSEADHCFFTLTDLSPEDGASARTPWIPEILPPQLFAEICQKTCFSVEDVSGVETILAYGYLSYIFFEHFAISGRQDYFEFGRFCRTKAKEELVKLPLLIPAGLETVAALTLGAFLLIENSEPSQAWAYVSAASNLCITLHYHLAYPPKPHNTLQYATQGRLFWTVYKLDKGLSARLGRASTLRDDEITLSAGGNDESVVLARVQARIYDELFSVAGLSLSDAEREKRAIMLATELRAVISETFVQAITSERHSNGSPLEQTRSIYLLANLVCEHSCLAQVLRAIPDPAQGGFSGASDECVKVARDCLELHDQCMAKIRACQSDPFIMKRYINWAILHTPFVPFNILFTHAIQYLDTTELDRLNYFAESLQPKELSIESPTHPYRLYSILCQAAKLHFDRDTAVSTNEPTIWSKDTSIAYPFSSSRVYEGSGIGIGAASGSQELRSWYYGNQQMMNLLNDNIFY